MTVHSAAHYFLEGLVDLGIDYIFANLGTDHVSLIEELARWTMPAGRIREWCCARTRMLPFTWRVAMPRSPAGAGGDGACRCRHRQRQHGHAQLFRGRLPVFLMAGRSPYTLHGNCRARAIYVHFVQDPYDIGSLVRPYVKWEYTLASGVVTKEVLRRGHAMMQSDPAGPVYLTLPRETLAAQWEESAVRAYPESRYGPVRSGGTDSDTALRIAEQLMAAKNPIAITAYLGRKAEAVSLLDALARECGIRVFEFNPVYLNIPRDSPCFAGYDPKAAIAEADVGLLLDVDVPWLPTYVPENDALRWLQIDVDAIKKDFPMWGFPTDLRLQADCATVLAQVLEIVRARVDADFRARVARRIAGWETAHQARSKAVATAAASPGVTGAISPEFLCAALARELGPDDVVINEAIRNTFAVLNQIPRTRPQSYLGLAGGGLGFSGGAALGMKLARPSNRVLQIVGDGGFHFSTPSSVYAVAQQYKLPIFTIVLDNGGWQAVKEAVLRVYPEGTAKAGDSFQARLEGEQRQFEQVARAFGAYGEALSDPARVSAAIKRCLAAVDAGQAAVLAVRVTPL
jgi:acetolactate synthase-1/2/3 large subunit